MVKEHRVAVGLAWVGVPRDILLEGIDLQLLGVTSHMCTRGTYGRARCNGGVA